MAAVCSDNILTLRSLVIYGCDLDVKTPRGETALDIAICRHKLEAVQILLEVMCPRHTKDSVSLQLAMAKTREEVKAIAATASLMYPHVAYSLEAPSKFAWIGWVLNEGGPLVKRRAMLSLLHIASEDQDASTLSVCL
jgi:hypothetical protein